jgi:pathogenesis-related protein 1
VGKVLCGSIGSVVPAGITASTCLALMAACFITSPVPLARAENQGTNLPAAGSQQCADSKLTNAEIDEILRIHNQARSKVGVGPLEWDCTLAKYAQRWVDQDKWKHSSDADYKSHLPPSYAFTGENLAVVAGSRRQITKEGIALWLSEQKDWNASTAQCQDGKICTHYTQVVWRKTTKIGCGINRNATVMGPRWRGQTQFLSCNYNPAGNVRGQKPY